MFRTGRSIAVAAASMLLAAGCSAEPTLTPMREQTLALPASIDTPQWVISYCDGPSVVYMLHPVDGSPATELHSYDAPRPGRSDDCHQSGAAGEVSPNGSHLLFPLEPVDGDQRSWAFYSTNGTTSTAQLGGHFNRAIWSPDETQVLALTHWLPQNWPSGDDSGGQADEDPGADFVKVDTATGKISPGISASSDLNVLLSWELDGRIVGRQSGPAGGGRPLTVTFENPTQQQLNPEDHYRLNQVGADDWRSIANGWVEIAFAATTPVCRLQAEVAPPWVDLEVVGLAEACVVGVSGVVGGQFLVTLERFTEESSVDVNVLVDPTSGTWSEFLSTSEDETIRIEHAAGDQVALLRRNLETGEQRLVVVDGTQTEIATLATPQDGRPIVIGLLRP